MAEMSLQLHFTFSPVQEFVAEARKTADLRSGSFILSYLAARAIVAAIGAGADRAKFFPMVGENELVKAVEASLEGGQDGNPKQVGKVSAHVREYGSLPNRFAVTVADMDEGAKLGKAAAKALQSGWTSISERARDQAKKNWPQLDDAYISGIWE